MTTYTIFGVVEESNDRRYSVHIDAESPEDAEKKAIQEAPVPIIVAGVVKGKVAALDQDSNADLTPVRGKGYVTQVATVRVDYRDFNVPFACPKCKADLLKPESMKQWDYWDYYWEGRVPRGVYKGDHGIAINHDKGARTGSGFETTIVAVVLQCNHCEYELWNGYKEQT
jgi:hypothetical protein